MALTGRPALPPPWSFGLWLTPGARQASFTTDYDKATVTHFVDGMAERDIPLHVFHFDCFWMKRFHTDGVKYQVFALDEGAVATTQVPALDDSVGATVEAHRVGSRIEVSVQGASPAGRRQPWSVFLRGVGDGTFAEEGTAQADELGVRVVPDAGAQAVSVRLEENV